MSPEAAFAINAALQLVSGGSAWRVLLVRTRSLSPLPFPALVFLARLRPGAGAWVGWNASIRWTCVGVIDLTACWWTLAL